ncbi:MAG: MFS transporter, partial [Rhodospirillaceae bacterium]|nr:MFS transporter [Rhodospirillaceae bacterium]
EANLIVQGAVALAIGMLLIPFSDGLPMLLIAMAIVAYGFGIITPSMNSLISLQVGPGEQGGVMGVTRSATTMARVLGPAWAGTMFMVLGKDWPYFGGAIIMVVVVYLGIRAARSTARD